MEPFHNFKQYRALFSHVLPPALPYMALVLSDLTSIDEANTHDQSDEQTLKWNKYSMVGAVIEHVAKYQVIPYVLRSISSVQNFLLLAEPIGDDEAYQLSCALEESERARTNTKLASDAGVVFLKIRLPGTKSPLFEQATPSTRFGEVLEALKQRYHLTSAMGALQLVFAPDAESGGCIAELDDCVGSTSKILEAWPHSQRVMVSYFSASLTNRETGVITPAQELLLSFGIPIVSLVRVFQKVWSLAASEEFVLCCERGASFAPLDMYQSLHEQGVMNSSLLLVYPLDSITPNCIVEIGDEVLKETLMKSSTKENQLGSVFGRPISAKRINLRKASEMSTKVVTTLRQPRLCVLKGRFLLYFKDSKRGFVQAGVISVAHFKVAMSKDKLTVQLNRVFEEFSVDTVTFLFTAPSEQSAKLWFDSLSRASIANSDTSSSPSAGPSSSPRRSIYVVNGRMSTERRLHRTVVLTESGDAMIGEPCSMCNLVNGELRRCANCGKLACRAQCTFKVKSRARGWEESRPVCRGCYEEFTQAAQRVIIERDEGELVIPSLHHTTLSQIHEQLGVPSASYLVSVLNESVTLNAANVVIPGGRWRLCRQELAETQVERVRLRAGAQPNARAIRISIHGASEAGKSALLTRLCDSTFDPVYMPTLEDKPECYALFEGQPVRLVFFDSGQLKIDAPADLHLICFNAASTESYDAAQKIRTQILQHHNFRFVAMVMVACQCDRARALDSKFMRDAFAKVRVPFFECSAKTGVGCDELFGECIALFVQLQKSINPADSREASGFLFKRGDVYRAWKKRWFVLNKSALQYFKQRKDAASSKNMAGLIALNDCTLNADSLVQRKNDGNTFALTNLVSGRVYYLYAEDREAKDYWVNLLRKSLENAQRTRDSVGQVAAQVYPVERFVARDGHTQAVCLFNENANKGVELLLAEKVVEASPQSVAQWMASTEALSKTKKGEYLGEPSEFALAVLRSFIELSIDDSFRGISFVVSEIRVRKLIFQARTSTVLVVLSFAGRSAENRSHS